ncbi:MAG: hypothetical protein ABIX00_00970 [Polaromonas sp.]
MRGPCRRCRDVPQVGHLQGIERRRADGRFAGRISREGIVNAGQLLLTQASRQSLGLAELKAA